MSQSKFNLETLTSFAKRKGFVFQSSEIYGGLSAVYDYGHYGTLLRNNIANSWVKSMLKDPKIKLLDSAIFTHPTTWKASGHLESFVEPAIDCRNCNERMKADHLLEPHGIKDADRMALDDINVEVKQLLSGEKLKCTKCGSTDLTEAKVFDLLVKSNLGSPTNKLEDAEIVYLRGETCQGIYLNYKNYLKTMRVQPPFGIAQVGKAFRNEVVARQFIFRTREFEQMEMQYFLHPDMMQAKYEEMKETRMSWWVDSLGIPKDDFRFKDHDKLAHYASAAVDIEYNFKSMGEFGEVEGIHQRGDWDLSRHQEFSGEKMEFNDVERGEKYIPNVMETAAGLSRAILVALDAAYTEEELEDGKSRIVMKFHPDIAPIKAAVFPLIKKPELQKVAKEIYEKLSEQGMVEYDESASIGKRYRRQDEIGTPICITVDFDGLEDGTVTVRDRDTLEQKRVKVEDLEIG